MDIARTELSEKLKTANNVLVTVSRNPSVDQLSACIGLTLLLNKLGKHTAAVFSGQVPSTLEFLKPGETLEKNTDSLRDFIIALDKSKADKLRYKVEDNVVRIFITPYRTSISEADLIFSQGDFNVDVVVALGVQKQEDLDEAITAHGRILHDATVASINASGEGGLGSINWVDKTASSLGELVTELSQTLGSDLLDGQIATALLTGIVAETNRFSNNKTSSQTMSISAALMAAGANQQLVATKLEESGNVSMQVPQAPAVTTTAPVAMNDVVEIIHDTPEAAFAAVPTLADQIPGLELPNVIGDEPKAVQPTEISRHFAQAPSMSGMLTANTIPEGLDESVDPLSSNPMPAIQMLDHNASTANNPVYAASNRPQISNIKGYVPDTNRVVFTPPPASWMPPTPPVVPSNLASTGAAFQTLSDLEKSVNSPHISDATQLNGAREEVSRALSSAPLIPEPVQALNAQQLGDKLHETAPSEPQVSDTTAPPPVPPPIPFQFKPPGA